MESGTPISHLGTEVSLYLNEAWPRLYRDSFLALAAIMAAAAGLSLLAFAFFRTRAAWVNRATTKKTFHYAFMGLLALFFILQLTHLSGTLDTVVAVSAFLSLAAGIVGLLRRRRFGVWFSAAALWLTLPAREISSVIGTLCDYDEIDRYSAPGKMGVFAAAQYIMDRMLVLAAIAAVFTVIAAVYYIRRRYLFTDCGEKRFLRAEACPSCGAVYVGAGDYCSVCGAKAEDHAYSVLKWTPLDKICFCPACGRDVSRKFGVPCELCREKNEGMSDFVKKLGAVLLAAALLAPTFFGDTPAFLAEGSAAANNAYVDRVNEWCEDVSVAEDAAWRASFDAADEALCELDLRGFRADTRRLNYAGLYMYVRYLEGSYSQVAVMEKLREAVDTGDTGDMAELAACFSETQNMQLRASGSTLRLLFSVDRLHAGENMVLDALRYYFSFIPVIAAAAVLFFAGLFGAVCGLILYRRDPSADPFVKLAEKTEEESVRREREAARAKRARADRRLTAITAAVTLLVLGGAIFFEIRTAPEPEMTYQTGMRCFAGDGALLLDWIGRCRTDPDGALAEKESVSQLVAALRETMAFLADAEPEEDGLQLSEKVRAVAAGLSDALERVQSALDGGGIPDRETLENTAKLLTDGMKLESIMETEAAVSAVADLF